jgi:hypothetical protein
MAEWRPEVTSAKLFMDEDASEEAVALTLRHHGIDVLTVHEAGRSGREDEDHLRFATSLGRVIYSLNARHFAKLHRDFLSRGEEHAGIIVIPRQRYGIGEKTRRLSHLLQGANAESLKNTLHFL